MKGVKINNYIDNRIVLSGRKMKNEMQTLIQAHRPRPIVIRHLNYAQAFDEDANDLQFHGDDKDLLKPIEPKSDKKKKKRNKTTNFQNIQIKQHHPMIKDELKVKSFKENTAKFMADKKRSIQSSPSGKSDNQFNQTQKRVKSASKSADGLGKRSKSAIIKRNKSPSNVCLDKSKKPNQPVSMRINLDKKKQTQPSKKKNHKKDKKSTETGKQLKKNVSSLNVSQRKKRAQKDQGTKTSRPTSKSITSTAKQSKPVSARDNKQKQSSHTKNKHSNLAQNLLMSVDRKSEKQHIALEQLLSIQQNDYKIKDAIKKLEQVINSSGSRKKISQKLQFLAEKLKEMSEQQQSSEQSLKGVYKQEQIRKNDKNGSKVEMRDQQKQKNQIDNAKIKNNQLINSQNINKQEFMTDKLSQVEKQAQKVIKQQNKKDNDKQGNQNIYKQKIKQQQKIAIPILNQQIQKSKQQQKRHQLIRQSKKIDLFSELFGVSKAEYHEDEKTQQKEESKDKLEDKKQNLVMGQDQQKRVSSTFENKRNKYKNETVAFRETLDHENGIYDHYDNPLIDRRPGDAYLNVAEYDSINSVTSNASGNSKQKQISQLKKFQQESNKMMQKIKEIELKKKKSQSPQVSELSNKEKNVEKPKQQSPKNMQIKNYGFDKYPNLQNIKSPKYISQQILSVIELKQRVYNDRHEKLSELVSVMYTKQLVSPRTYSIQVQNLRQQHEHNSEIIDSYKKHAEELAKILSEIKKQKQQINQIDDLIRSEKWDKAISVIKQTETYSKTQIKQISNIPQVPITEQDQEIFKKVDSSQEQEPQSHQQEEQEEEVIYYEGQKSETEDNRIKLLKVPYEQEHQFNEESESETKNKKNKDIVIDEANIPKKQRGFDSNLFFIKEYCIALCEYVRDNYKQDFRLRIGKPKSYDLIKLLKSFGTSNGTPSKIKNSQYEQLDYYGCEHHNNIDPISRQIFDEFNKKYQSIKFFGKQSTQLAGLQEVFLISIFDALNQSISMEKPAGTYGQSLPWANDSKNLKNLKNSLQSKRLQKKEESQDFIFGAAIARIIHWGSNLCGFIADTVDLENTQIDQQYVAHIRQTRLQMLLQKMVQNQQVQITQYQLQDTQVLLSLSDLVYQSLIDEVYKEINSITLKSVIKGFQF